MNVSPLFVDKFALTWDCCDESSEGIHALINDMSNDPNFHIHYHYRGRLNTNYKDNWRVAVPESAAVAIVSVTPLFTDMAPFRIEWNPARLEAYQADWLWYFLSQITLDHFDSFVREAVVTRIDLAIDIRPMRPRQLLTYVSRLQKEQTYFKGGELVSTVYGDGGNKLSISFYVSKKVEFVTGIGSGVRQG